MKVALVHDYIKEYGGAERVLEVLHDMWPDAPIFTSVYLPEFLGPHEKRFASWDIRPSFLQKFPGVAKLISPIRLITPWVFEQWDLRDFDVVIVSATGAYFPNMLVRKSETVHICYCHTPPRYLYGYPTARRWSESAFGRIVAGLLNHRLRQIDYFSYQRPDYIVANSKEVKRRIKKFYRRDATVIYPPVAMADEIPKSRKAESGKQKTKRYFLTGGRLARAKHIDIAIEACNRLHLPLKVFGRGFADYDRELRAIAGPTVEFVGEVADEELQKLYVDAIALIYPSEAEDFGIMPVEAQAHGIPVLALAQGGVMETVLEGKTGIFFHEATVESVIAALERLKSVRIQPEDCKRQAAQFSKAAFVKTFRAFVEEHAGTS